MDVLSELMGVGNTTSSAATTAEDVVIAVGLTFVLTVVIAFVYQHTHRGAVYSQDYVHTLMILGMVVTSVVMVVSITLVLGLCAFCLRHILGEQRPSDHHHAPLDIDTHDTES